MRNLLILFLLFTPMLMLGQSETDNWFFGEESGLTFSPARVVINPDGKIQAPAGCAVISDVNRNLLFYTNGETVWNANHEIMENGEGLAGEIENAQSALIVPKPESKTNYYIFTTRKTNGPFTAGVKYSEVEISGNFPLGRVIEKNVSSSNFSTEKITAVYSTDGNTIYVIAFGTLLNEANALYDSFSIYEVTTNGVSSRTTIEMPDIGTETSTGVLKVAPDGTLIAMTVYDFNENEAIHLLEFNRDNGNINYIRKMSMNIGPGAWTVPYGVEFSKNGKYIYHTGNYNYGPSYVRQIELQSSSPIGAQSAILAGSDAVNYRSLQMASDGRIYIAKQNSNDTPSRSLSIIHNPEVFGADTNYQDEAFRGFSSFLGLPNFISTPFSSEIVADNQCFVDPFTFSATSYVDVIGAEWDFGDGNTGSGLGANHTYNAPGEYMVEALLTLSNQTQTRIYREVTAYELPNLIPNQELVECDDDTDGLTTFNLFSIHEKITNINLNETLVFYLNQGDLINDQPIANPENFQNTRPDQEIFVKVINENGCFEFTSFFLRAKFVPLGDISTFYTCENSDNIAGNAEGVFNASLLEQSIRSELNIIPSTSLTLYRSKLDAQTNTNALVGDFTSTTSTLYVKGQQADLSCAGIQEFNVIVNSSLDAGIADSYEICFDPSLQPPVIISADPSFERFEWRNSNGDLLGRDQTFTLTNIGEYFLTVQKTENGISCSNTTSFQVTNPDKPIFITTNVNTEDETNNIIEVQVDGNSSYEFSLDNINFEGAGHSHIFTQVPAGLQTVYVKDRENCEETIQITLAVIGFMEYFTPNGDGHNDFWNIKGLDNTSFQSISVYIFNRFGRILYHITDFDDPGWDGRLNGSLLPGDSYWFKAKIVDKEDRVIEKTALFSLLNQ